MYNLTQFVLKFLISFLLVFSLYVFIVYLHLLKHFFKFLKIINTSYVHIYIYLPLYFYHSLDNDGSTVERLCFTVDFYC